MTRREWLSLALLGAQVALMASCGGDDDDSPADDAPSRRVGTGSDAVKESQPITLAVLDNEQTIRDAEDVLQAWEKGSIPGLPEGAVLQHVAMPVPAGDNYADRATLGVRDFLAAGEAGGVTADVVWLPFFVDIMDLCMMRALAPLDRWLQADKHKPFEAFVEEARSLVRVRGETQVLPVQIAPAILEHNAIRFRRANLAAPTHEWTWDDFIAAAGQLTVDTDGDGATNRWGFASAGWYPDWLHLLMQEGGVGVDLNSGKIDMDEPAAFRALNAWDELGRVHGILPHGPDVTLEQLEALKDFYERGMHFSPFFGHTWEPFGPVTPLPQGTSDTTPLGLIEALGMPPAAQDEKSYATLVALALWLGERRVLPTTTAGWKFVERPDGDHFDLVFPDPVKATALESMARAKASHVASGWKINQWLHHNVTFPLAREEMVIEQAIQQATNWLRSYVYH
ncbi:MAG: extracellular solute-binding protein [Chloroflexota bacterium]|nr:extracellular solute-binding protein [Chloroflexota bacterium]